MISRRRYMGGGGSPAEYIQEGLVFCLDGIDKGDDENSWTELIGKGSFTGTAVRGNNCYTFNDNVMTGVWSNGESEDFTVELCFHPTNANVAVFGVSGSVTNYPLYVRINNKVTWLNRRKTYTVDSSLPYITSSFSQSLAVENGIERSSGSNDYWSMSSDMSVLQIGKGTAGTVANNPFVGDLYAIRIYNRRLNKSEMLNNQKIDNKRFNLGLVL